jgi:hypothetical protein
VRGARELYLYVLPRYDKEIELPCPRLSLSTLLGEKSNLTDGEKRTRTAECCRTIDEE